MDPQTKQRFPTLAGKVAIVTGGSRGIGREIALEFAKRGAKVSIVYTSPSSASATDALIGEIASLENTSAGLKIQADLRETIAPGHIVAETQKAFGPHIDILVNNAGVAWGAPVKNITAADLAHVFDLNIRSYFLMAGAVIPALRSPGRIINISSVGGRCGFRNMSAYSASKAAVEAMVRALAVEIGGEGHTANAVEPGPVESDMLDQVPKELVETQRKATAVENRIGNAEDIALIVAWLAGEESRWVTGQTISASGGYLML